MLIQIKPEVPTEAKCHVPVSHQNHAIIDPEDYELVRPYYWRAIRSRKQVYAVAKYVKDGQTRYIRMHRLIMDCPKDKIVHHKNHNTLDNRKCNLEVMTSEEHKKTT